jgi:hypothetical protein
MRLRLSALILAALLLLAMPALAVDHSQRLKGTPVPAGFVGVNLDGPPLSPADGIDLNQQLGLMVRNGVQSVRVTFSWADAQPYASWADVPQSQAHEFVGGTDNVPTDFAGTDQLVKLVAEHHLTLQPIVIYAPGWDAAPHSGSGLAAPRDDQPYGNFLTTLIDRYGPGGGFWSQNPQLKPRPIRNWEIWNEPDIVGYWPIQPFARSYVALLKVAHDAIKAADPGAQVVLAGFPNASWIELGDVYAVNGARGLFDAVDVHPYTKKPAGVITILRYVRSTMNRHGDARKPMYAGEISWPSSLHQTPQQFDFETTEAGQAKNLATMLPLLAANRRRLVLAGFDWYTWMGNEYKDAYPFNFSGLLGYHGGKVFTKPALAAFSKGAHALER